MASKESENAHALELQTLLEKNNLVCDREEDEEEEAKLEEHPQEEILGEEAKEEMIEETQTEQEEEEEFSFEEEWIEKVPVFPSPSLRRMIPEKLRRIDAQNRFKALPDRFNSSVDPSKIPKIKKTEPQQYIQVLGQLIGCSSYETNMAEFWCLDTLANLLRRAQEEKMDKPAQAVLILWFCEWMKAMEHFDAANRNRMMERWKDNMRVAAKFIDENRYLPTPAEAGVYYEKLPDIKTTLQETSTTDFKEGQYECALADLVKITHYIYDLMSTDYQYNLVRMVFTFGPDIHQIEGPYQIEMPKKGYEPENLKEKTKKEPKQKKEPKPKKVEKAEKVEKPKKNAPAALATENTEEYDKLMELKKKDEEAQQQLEQKEIEEYIKKSSILPLNMAFDQELFEAYFPPLTRVPSPPLEMSPVPIKPKGDLPKGNTTKGNKGKKK